MTDTRIRQRSCKLLNTHAYQPVALSLGKGVRVNASITEAGVPSRNQDPRQGRPGGKNGRRMERWHSPLPISLLRVARLNFLYS